MKRKEIIQKYLEFFKEKDHAIIPSAPLVPENDPTVLFTTAGMQPLVPFLLGEKHPLGKRIVDVQKCIRTGDIEEVGDTTHHTFFEMLGNWSLGDYFKNEAIEYSFKFLTKVLNIPIERLAVTVFEGDKNAPKDKESFNKWKSLGIPEKRIAFLGKDDNWWGPAGETGPCGPDTEMFYWKLNNVPAPETFDPKDDNWVEIWNDVLMEYVKDKEGNYNKAKQQNVDTGMGVERIVAVLNGLEDNYLSNCWELIIKKIEEISKKEYNKNEKEMRIIADHIKAAVFMIADGVIPGNIEQGYILRRLIRRAIRHGKNLGMNNFTRKIAEPIFEIYDDYSELTNNKKNILEELEKEEEKFNQTLEKGLNKFQKMTKKENKLSGKDAFLLFQSFGFPKEMIEEECEKENISFNPNDFDEALKEHQELSRTASKGKFKSGLADDSEATTRLHTAAHLLLSALRITLKDTNIVQRGSNITPERLRLDVSFPRKIEEDELQKVEDLVNAKIQESCEVIREEMCPADAKAQGALGNFAAKYGDIVSVYTIEDFSKEICTGPHVKNTCELGHFKIKKESSSGAGVRRIKAVLD